MSFNSSECLNDGAFGPPVVGCRDDFDFTTFFEQVLLSITPSACFELLALVRIGYLVRKPGIVLARQFQFLKLAAISIYAAIALSLVVLLSKSPVVYTSTSVTAAVLSFINAILFLGLSSLEHTRSLRSSTLLNSYLLLSLLFDAVQTRTLWLRDPSSPVTNLFTTALGFKFGMLLLEAQGKSRWIRDDARSPEALSGIWSLSFFSWLNSLILAGYRKILSVEDLFPLDNQLSINAQREGFNRQWSTFRKQKRLRLLRALLATLKWNLIGPILPRLASGGFTFAQPFLINSLLRYLQQDDDSRVLNYGYGFIAAGALVYIGLATSRGLYWYLHQRTLAVLRACLVSAVYQATMDLDITSSDTSGPLTLMNSDVAAVQDGFQNLHEYWVSLIEVVLASWLLQQQLGSAFVAPILVVVLCGLAAIGFGKFVGKQQKLWMKAIQKRVSLTASIIPNMISIKMSGLAPGLRDAVQRWRQDELDAASRFRIFTTFTAVIAFTPLLISPVAAFGATNKEVSTTRVFTSLAYISLLCSPLTQLFQTIPYLMAAITSLQRVEEFLDSVSDTRRLPRDYENQSRETLSAGAVSPSAGVELREVGPRPGVAVSIQNGVFGWEEGRNILREVNAEIPASKLVMITGPVGSGKSTLLKGILGETPLSQGTVQRAYRQAGFCDQATFLKNASIRENIIAFSQFESSWYDRVVKATGLDVDIAMLPKKDQTSVGTKGISLSGGQRQRIALARALYSRNKIILLDDVVSGLDRHTEAHVFRQVLGPSGLFREIGASVILCTPLLRHLSFADYIIVLENGTVSKQGTLKEIAPELGVFRARKENGSKTPEQSDEETCRFMPPSSPESAPQTEDKTRQLGDIQAYKYYLSRVGALALVLFSVSGAVFAFLYDFGAVWLEFWSSSTARGEKKDSFYLGIYILLNVSCLFALVVYAGVAGISMTRRAGYKIHFEALTTLFQARLYYFTSVDAGVTINIFSQVMSIVDRDLSMNFSNTVLTGLTAIGQAAVIASASPYILAGYPVLLGVLYVLCQVYLRTSRQLRYLDIETKAPLYSHFLETLNGLATIRAFDWVSPSIEECHRLLDESQRPDYLLAMIQHWLNLVLNLTVGVLAVIIIALATQLRTSAGFTGVGLVTLMSFGQMGANLVRIYAMLETAIAALSRLKSFTETAPREREYEDDGTADNGLVLSGSVVFDHVSAAYETPVGVIETTAQLSNANNDGLALRDISLSIDAGKKVAICGRSGSGKSSLLLILTRLLDPQYGTVKIGSQLLSSINRQTLRSVIITLPQTPFYLPEGTTFRQNLDFQDSTDHNCEYALRSVGLWEFVMERGGLDGELKADALSQGQKQLFSLARAVLRARVAIEQDRLNGGSSPVGGVLLLDEVNSSVDNNTDLLMQEIIMREFANYTIICVAHRLDSVVRWYDRVVVMDSGNIVETGPVEALLAKENGAFKGLWLAGRGNTDLPS